MKEMTRCGEGCGHGRVGKEDGTNGNDCVRRR